ncbi:hypothetical protein DC094_10645 [Pelagibaculum spongiae]|uniref:Knr4/Smi1-like domain-containing protein n=1 Tax=Pelagibaculum spongiae TaxID=2080658 RepID=A0A2V1H365_9GAMM|nr:hypothetical protein DC094_10645 [Pelagibaculum spongiae]
MSAISPEIQDSLQPPISNHTINQLEQQWSCCLPNDYRRLHKFSSGQNHKRTPGLWLGLHWLTLEQHFFCQSNLDYQIISPEQIQQPLRSEKWLVFAGNHSKTAQSSKQASSKQPSSGASLAIDFSPAGFGTVGQILVLFHHSKEVSLLADSFGSFIDDFLHRLDDHQLTSDCHGQLLSRNNPEQPLIDQLHQQLRNQHARCSYR